MSKINVFKVGQNPWSKYQGPYIGTHWKVLSQGILMCHWHMKALALLVKKLLTRLKFQTEMQNDRWVKNKMPPIFDLWGIKIFFFVNCYSVPRHFWQQNQDQPSSGDLYLFMKLSPCSKVRALLNLGTSKVHSHVYVYCLFTNQGICNRNRITFKLH